MCQVRYQPVFFSKKDTHTKQQQPTWNDAGVFLPPNWLSLVHANQIVKVEDACVLAVFTKKQLEHAELRAKLHLTSASFWNRILSLQTARMNLDAGRLPALVVTPAALGQKLNSKNIKLVTICGNSGNYFLR